MRQRIYHPHLCLFSYSLKSGVGQDIWQFNENHKNFWRKLQPDSLKIPLQVEEQAGYSNNLDLLKLHRNFNISKTSRYDFPEDNSEKEYAGPYPVDGFYLPVRLADTYCLLFVCSIPEEENSHDINCFYNLKNNFERTVIAASNSNNDIGKTWMLSGYLLASSEERISEDEFAEQAEELAKQIYRSFSSQEWSNLDVKQSRFLGGCLFEVWLPPQHWENSIEENIHILIFIYTNSETMSKFGKFYRHWLSLFYYRNKIIWAYGNTRRARQKHNFLKDLSSPKLAKDRELDHMKVALEDNYPSILNFSNDLSNLEIQSHTIEVNLANYNRRLKKIIRLAAVEENNTDSKLNQITKIDNLFDFSDYVEKKYREQIRNDVIVISSALKVREKFIYTVRSLVEIEQAKLDRNRETSDSKFRNFVQEWGISLAVTSLTINTFKFIAPELVEYLIDTLINSQQLNITSFAEKMLAFVLILLVGTISLFISRFIVRRYQVRGDKIIR